MTVTIEQLRHEGKKKAFPSFKSGQTVRVHCRVKEGAKERVQIFEGLIIAVNGGTSISQTIIVRKISNGIAVEQGFAVHAPSVEKIELVKVGKVRQSRIYFMRDRQGKSARLKERFYTEAEIKSMTPELPVVETESKEISEEK